MVAAITAVSGCGKKPDAAPAKSADLKTVAMTAAPAVTVAPVTRGSIAKSIDVNGSLVALQDVIVGPKMAGRVAQVTPHEGDPVTAGQVVGVMDTADLQAQVAAAQANVQAALTREQQARAALLQTRQGLVQARNAVRNAETNRSLTDKTTSAAVATAKSGVQAAKEYLSIVQQGARPQERAQAQQQVNSAKSNFDKARADLRRYQELFREQAVSQSQLDQAQATADAAEAQYNSAREALSLIKEGARPEEVRRAQLAVQQAEDALLKAQADREAVRLRDEDIRSARSNVQSAAANIASAEAAVRTAEAGTAQSRASLRVVQDALSYAYIKSPISGIVAERKAEPGQQLGAGAPVIRVVNPSTVYFQATLAETQIAQIRVGQTVSVAVDALPGQKFSGRVSRVLPVASSARSFTVRVDIPSDRRMRPQMFARGSILIDTHQNATLVPKDAVLFDAVTGKSRVFVTDSGGKAKERAVQVGFSNPSAVEVLGGVKPGEKVIVAGQTALQNGDVVRIQ
jgi:RND family efflux transporter MFP subunit